MITPQHVRTALEWLGDLPNRPVTDLDSHAGKAWLQRLSSELSEVGATGTDLVDACRALSRAPGAFHPTPGQIAAAVVEHRVARAKDAREHEWRGQRAAAPLVAPPQLGGGAQVPAGFAQRDQGEFFARIVDLIQRGHPGPAAGGEPYVAAVLREEAEEASARASGASWRAPRYGPSLVPKGPGTMAGALSGALERIRRGRVDQ